MTDLAKAIFDAAAEQFDHGEQWKDIYVDPDLRAPFIEAVAVAVLETLAKAYESFTDTDGELSHPVVGAATFRELAGAVRGVGEKGTT